MNLTLTASSSVRRALGLILGLTLGATLAPTSAVAGDTFTRNTPGPSRTGNLTDIEPPPVIPGDLTDIDDGIGPDPGVDDDPLAPVDGGFVDHDGGLPPGPGDLETDATEAAIVLTAANPWHPMAYLKADYSMRFIADPKAPKIRFEGDPANPHFWEVELEIHVHALAGYDYDITFCTSRNSAFDGTSLNIWVPDMDILAAYVPDTSDDSCEAPTWVGGPEIGESAQWHTVYLYFSMLPEGIEEFDVDAIRIVASPHN